MIEERHKGAASDTTVDGSDVGGKRQSLDIRRTGSVDKARGGGIRWTNQWTRAADGCQKAAGTAASTMYMLGKVTRSISVKNARHRSLQPNP